MDTDELVTRNAAFAASGGFAGLSFRLGIKLGEAVIMRNLGGRITPTTLCWWKLLGIVAIKPLLADGRRTPRIW